MTSVAANLIYNIIFFSYSIYIWSFIIVGDHIVYIWSFIIICDYIAYIWSFIIVGDHIACISPFIIAGEVSKYVLKYSFRFKTSWERIHIKNLPFLIHHKTLYSKSLVLTDGKNCSIIISKFNVNVFRIAESVESPGTYVTEWV